MNKEFSKECMLVMEKAYELATSSGGLVGTEHLLCGMLACPDSVAGKILATVNLTKGNILNIISLDKECENATMTERTKRAIITAEEVASSAGNDEICSNILLFAVLLENSSYAFRALENIDVNINRLMENLSASIRKNNSSSNFADKNSNKFKFDMNDFDDMEDAPSESTVDESMEKLGCDLTLKAKQGKLDPVIGRSNEIERIIQILSRRTKNNPVLIGEPGVGKSAIVEGLAQAIVKGEVPEMLKNKKVFSLDMASLLAGTKYRGEMEERLKKTIDTIKNSGDTILFIDEIHTIVGAGSSNDGSMDVANILKPQLEIGRAHV